MIVIGQAGSDAAATIQTSAVSDSSIVLWFAPRKSVATATKAATECHTDFLSARVPQLVYAQRKAHAITTTMASSSSQDWQNDTFDNCFDDGFFDNDVDNYFTRGSEMILNPVVRCEPLEQRRIPRLLQRARSTHGVLGRVHADLPRFTRSDVFNTLH